MYETLVLGSGGVRGLAILGALSKVENKGLLKKINHLVGCSTGSIISLLYILGYTFDNIIQLYLNIDFWDQLNINLDSILNITTSLGIIDTSQKFKNILRILLTNSKLIKLHKIKLTDLTFLKLFQLTNIKLTICITNLNKCEPSYLNYENTPNILVEDGVRKSCAIPFLFQPIDNCIDGAVCNSYPINQTKDITKTLGIIVKDTTCNKSHEFIQHIFNIVRSIEINNIQLIMKDEDIKNHTIIIPCPRDIKDKNKILKYGLLHGEKWLEKYNKINPIFHLFTKKFLNKLKNILILKRNVFCKSRNLSSK